jgi:glycosyltransferase involved in cell wall biosynthesis
MSELPDARMPRIAPTARVALVHDWLTGMRGGEYVLEAMAQMLPGAELFTLLHVPGTIHGPLTSLPLHTSALQRMPGAANYYRHYLPLLPAFASTLDVRDFDVVVSSTHCVAKGVRKSPKAVHVSYVHAPMRYMWDRFDDYFGPGKTSAPVRLAARLCRPFLQGWDKRVSQVDNVDRLIANSAFIARQVERNYGRPASVIHPFANVDRFTARRAQGTHYLMVGAFAPNKRVDIAIEAFNELKLPLKIVGKGQEEARLRRLAGPTIEFLGSADNEAIAELYATARAFIFPGIEDFGITPLEAMSAGCPVIAYAEGGALETVVDKITGLYFHEQTAAALTEAVRQLEFGGVVLHEDAIRSHARRFSKQRFQAELQAAIVEACLSAGRADLVEDPRASA